MALISVQVIVTGRVQGVGFRYFVLQEANKLKVVGWVRNCSDGTVEALGCGTSAQLDAWADALRQGPPTSRVDRIQINPLPQNESYSQFEIR